MLLDPFYQGVQKIFLTPARLEKFFGLQPPVFGFNQVDRSEYDRSGVSGDDAVMTENACNEEKKLMTHKMNTGYLLMKHAWNHMYQTIQLR